MNSVGNHIIRSQVFEVGYYQPTGTLSFQKELTFLIRDELNAITERCLDIYESGRTISIEKLELNLGQIPHDRLKQLLPKQYKEELQKALRRSVNSDSFVDQVGQLKSQAVSGIQQIVHFLVKGYMPWNYDPVRQSFNQLFQQSLDQDPQSLLEALQTIMKSDQVKIRLITNLEHNSITALVTRLEPTEAQLIIQYHSDWCTIQKTKPVFKGSEQEIARHLWLFIFKYLYDERGSYFNTKSFLISTLRQIALQFNLPFGDVIRLLRLSYESMSHLTTGSTFNNLISDIINEFDLESNPEEVMVSRKVRQSIAGQVQSLIRFAKSLSDIDTPLKAAESNYETVFASLLAYEPEALLQVLRQLGDDEAAVYRLIEPLEEKLIHRVIYLLEPSHGIQVINYHADIVNRQQKESFIKAPVRNFPRVIWSMVIIILVDSHGSHFSQKTFAAALIRRIANRFNLAYRDLLSNLHVVLKTPGLQHNATRLWHIVSELYDDEFGKVKAPAKPAKKELRQIDPQLVLNSILKGRLLSRLYEEGKTKDLKTFMEAYIARNPRTFKEILLKGSADKTFIQQLVSTLEADILLQLGLVLKVRPFWKKLYKLVTYLQVPETIEAARFKNALRELIIEAVIGGYGQKSAAFEQAILRISTQHHLSLAGFIGFLKLAADKVENKEFAQLLKQVVLKYGLKEAFNSGRFSQLPWQETISREKTQTGRLIQITVKSLEGIVDVAALRQLGFPDVDSLISFLLQHHQEALKSSIIHDLPRLEVYKGIGREVSIATFHKLIGLVVNQYAKQLTALLEKLEKASTQGSEWSRFLNTVYALVLVLAVQKKFKPDTFIKALLDILFKAGRNFSEQVIALLLPSKFSLGRTGANSASNGRQMLHYHTPGSESSMSLDREKIGLWLEKAYFEGKVSVPSEPIPYWGPDREEIQEVFIDNAGLVLLQPFYPSLFKQLKLVDDTGRFETPMKEKAAIILQYVLVDSPELGEENLFFNKLLVGLEADYVVTADPLSGSEKQTILKLIHGMITAAIAHWPAIGKSSVDGFRANWLYRKGKLELGEDSWELHVERKPYDLLMDQLPFGISPVNYSWMKKPLTVYWQ